MEQSVHKRVYINPNFKRNEVEPWPAVPVKTTHFNRHYLDELPNKYENPPTLNNRRIFVNPNFITGSNTQSRPTTTSGYYVQPNVNLNSTSTGYVQPNANLNATRQGYYVKPNENSNLTSTGYVQPNERQGYYVKPNENTNSTSTGYVPPNENLNATRLGYYVKPNENSNSTSTGYVQPNENLNATRLGYYVKTNENLNSTSTGYVQPIKTLNTRSTGYYVQSNENLISQSIGYHVTPNQNLNCKNVPNDYLLHKSKYSLINQQTVANQPAKMETNKNKSHDVKKITQEVPLTRSRYCIVRKKKRLSINSEYKSVSIGSATLVPITHSNLLTCYSHIIKNSDRNKLNQNTINRVSKIRITKYKTVPISYLKKNPATGINKDKFVASPLKTYLRRSTKLNSSLIICNKNRYKFIKTSTPVSTVKVTSKISQYKDKVIKSGNKIKLSRSLRAKFNINNIPCRLFTKFGKCLRQDQGNCKYLHDKKHVLLCRKFLKGICHDNNCTLSHELTHKKMPTCYFYLKGMCTKECCPYLHVKLSDKTKICQEFAKGYCENGDKCLFRHVNFDKIKKKRKASMIFQRSSQDKVIKSKQQKKEKVKTENCEAIKNLEETVQKDDEDCRYYKELVTSDDNYEIIKPTRCKLGTLPSFIHLG